MGPHKNQGQTSECVTHAHCSQQEFCERKEGCLNPLDPHKLLRQVQGHRRHREAGTYPRVAYDIERKDGVPETQFVGKPEEISNAASHRIASYAACGRDIDLILQAAVASGIPVGVSIEVWQSLYDRARVGGIVPMPRRGRRPYSRAGIAD